MTVLPTPGGDDDIWGGILNDFLMVSLNADGTLNQTVLAALCVLIAGGSVIGPDASAVNGLTIRQGANQPFGLLLELTAANAGPLIQTQDQNGLPIFWSGILNNSAAGWYASLSTYADNLSAIGWWGQADGVNSLARGYSYLNRWGSAYFDVGAGARFFGTYPQFLPLTAPGNTGTTVTASTVAGASSFNGSPVYYVMTAKNLAGTETVAGPQVTVSPTSAQQVQIALTASSLGNSTQFGAAEYGLYRSTTSGTYGASSFVGYFLLEPTLVGGVAKIMLPLDTGTATVTGTPPTAPTPAPFIIQGWPGEPTTNDKVQLIDGAGSVWLRIKSTGNVVTVGSVTAAAGVDVSQAGHGLAVAEGSNAKQGVATLSAGTVVVANTSVTTSSRIQLTAQSLGTVSTPQALAVTARTGGTSFTITSASASDTSVVAYEIFEPG